ncbi:MAG TPA: DUF971 domain-containing protein [Acidimicrobiia bacterium]|nr:DUF971 domain-containing protein [Acidimicrobiia bacterium]
MDLPEEPPPESVDLDRRVGLTIRWADGTEDRFDLAELRLNCPCAECRGRREQHEPIWPRAGKPDVLEATGAELVGGWGISLRWNDSHDTGIYAWAMLKAWRGTTS